MQRRTQPKLVGEQVLELALAAEAAQARAAAVAVQTMMVDYCKSTAQTATTRRA